MFVPLHTVRRSRLRKSSFYLLVLIFFMSGLLFFPISVRGLSESQLEDARLENAVKEQFFKSLTEARATRLLARIDREQELTASELGAKYRWGYIPVDRRIPDRLGEWWRDLSSSEKRRHRLNWFRRFHMRLDVDRAAARLDLNDRLFQIQRKIEKKWYRRDIDLEKVEFDFDSGSSKDESREAGSSGDKISAERKDKEPKKSKTKAVEKESVVENGPGTAGKETVKKDKTRPEEQEKSIRSTEEKEPKDKGNISEDKQVTSPAGKEAADTETGEQKEESTEPEEQERSPFIYRRTGDGVKIIRRQEGEADTSPEKSDLSSEEDTGVETKSPSRRLNIDPPRLELEE